METKKILMIVLISFVSYCVGLQTGVSLPSGAVSKFSLRSNGTAAGANTYEAGWEAAKKRVKEYGFVPMMDNMEFKSVIGEVQKIDGQKMTLKIRPLEPLADPDLDTRIATFGTDVKVFKLSMKDQNTYQKEMEEANAKMKNYKPKDDMPTPPPMMPSMMERIEVKLSDLKTGSRVTVVSADNIKDKKEFSAKEIEIQIDYANTPVGAPVGAPAATPPASAVPTAPATGVNP